MRLSWVLLSALLSVSFATTGESFSPKTLKTGKKFSNKTNLKAVARLKENLRKVEQSIQITKSRMNSPQEIQFLPDLYLMLAELYAEKSRYMYSIKLETNLATPLGEIDFTAAKRPKQDAIENYKALIDRFPQYANLDRALFALGHEYREFNDLENAIKIYKQIIDRFPNSELWEESQLHIGNIYFEKKDFEFAVEQYQKVIKRKNQAMTSVALYKMATSYIYLDQFLKSMQTFDQLMKANQINSEDSPEEFKKVDIREEALVASVWPLTELKPEDLAKFPEFFRPIEYYKNVSFDKPSYRRVLSRLARRLTVKKRHEESAQAWFELLRLADDPSQRREAMESFYLASKDAKKTEYPINAAREVALTLRLLKLEKSDEMKYEAVLRDLATSAHRSAMKTKRIDDLMAAVDAYEDYLWIFETSKYRNQMVVNMAEAYFHAQHFVESGLTYFEASNATQDPRLKKDYLASSVQAFIESFKDLAKLSQLEKSQGRSGFRRAANVYIKAFPDDKEVSKIFYNLGKSLYDEQKYDAAVKSLRTFLARFPMDENARSASLLILDCFYVRDDMKGLVQESKSLMTQYRLSPATRAEIKQVSDQAKLKNVRSLAGDFNDKNYADQFLKFAQSNKGSALGESAMLEAFSSLKANNDFKVFEVGAQYVGQFPNSPKSKDILLTMSQLALVTADFRRAAAYLSVFSQRFPSDPNAQEYAKQSAYLYEQLGETEGAFQGYSKIGDKESAGRVLFVAGSWEQLGRLATSLAGIKGLFYQGISSYRKAAGEESIGLLRRASQEVSSSADEKSMRGHAGFIVATQELKQYKAIGQGVPFTPQVLQQKVAALQNFDRMMQDVISLGVGRWTIASLAMMGQAHKELVRFLKAATIPTGMTKEQFVSVLKPQANKFTQSSEAYFKECLESAEKYDVFTRFVKSCQSQGAETVDESKDTRIVLKASSGIPSEALSIKKKLFKDPRDMKSLQKLVELYVRAKDYPTAFVITNRMIEIEPTNALYIAQLGMLQLYMNQIDLAFATFQETLKKDPRQANALWGVTGLYKKFGFKRKYQFFYSQARAAGKPQLVIHPWINEAL